MKLLPVQFIASQTHGAQDGKSRQSMQTLHLFNHSYLQHTWKNMRTLFLEMSRFHSCLQQSMLWMALILLLDRIRVRSLSQIDNLSITTAWETLVSDISDPGTPCDSLISFLDRSMYSASSTGAVQERCKSCKGKGKYYITALQHCSKLTGDHSQELWSSYLQCS